MFFLSLFIGGAVPGTVIGLIEIFKGNGKLYAGALANNPNFICNNQNHWSK
tara:strand:+ start:668 stop:820 length:153 start_codon:yes stop_codon:yes gene_type:complete